MSYTIATFVSDLTILDGIHPRYANKAAELTAIATALSTDLTKHDKTIEAAPAGLIAGHPVNSHFTNDVLLVVNAGKAGNLTPAAMGAAITAGIPPFPPY